MRRCDRYQCEKVRTQATNYENTNCPSPACCCTAGWSYSFYQTTSCRITTAANQDHPGGDLDRKLRDSYRCEKKMTYITLTSTQSFSRWRATHTTDSYTCSKYITATAMYSARLRRLRRRSDRCRRSSPSKSSQQASDGAWAVGETSAPFAPSSIRPVL